jgi:Domain of unknown function (DUF6851)
MSELGYATDGSDSSSAAAVGATAAQAVLDFRPADGSNQANNYADSCVPACYQPVNTADVLSDPDHWQPLRLPNGTVQSRRDHHTVDEDADERGASEPARTAVERGIRALVPSSRAVVSCAEPLGG